MFKAPKKKTVERLIEDVHARENEELLFAQVVKEIETGQRRNGL